MSTEIAPVHQYDNPGIYVVELTTVGAAGNEFASITTKEIVIE
jgi:PKD repeat protein